MPKPRIAHQFSRVADAATTDRQMCSHRDEISFKSTPSILKKSSLAAAIFLGAASSALAQIEVTAVATHVTGRLTRIQVGLSAGAYAYIDASLSALNCTPGGVGDYMTLQYTHARYADMYALLLTAKAAGQPVTFRINEGTAGCTLMYVIAE